MSEEKIEVEEFEATITLKYKIRVLNNAQVARNAIALGAFSKIREELEKNDGLKVVDLKW